MIHQFHSSTKLKSDITEDVSPGQLRGKKGTTVIAHRHSDVPTSSTHLSNSSSIISPKNRSSSIPSSASSTSSSSNQPMRPRFNTLELDLSCTKNKFPITDRRKQFQQMIKQKSPNSAPATPTEWSFQVARNGDPNGFLRTHFVNQSTNSQPTTAINHSQGNGITTHTTETASSAKSLTAQITSLTATTMSTAPPPKQHKPTTSTTTTKTSSTTGDTIH